MKIYLSRCVIREPKKMGLTEYRETKKKLQFPRKCSFIFFFTSYTLEGINRKWSMQLG